MRTLAGVLMNPPPRKKKRAHLARKIIPRGNMGVQWVLGALGLAAVILVLGVVFLFTHR